MRSILALLVVMVMSSLGAADVGRRAGANHHLGDDSFVAAFGRAPTAADSEAVRMHTHLVYVRALLGAKPATSPELAGRRAELLGYLDDYIAAGITPRNTYVPWRNPVFIDADGRICAVGYLIERSVGRALPERIAAAHRLGYLEDIAAAMPEVAAWAASSGLALEELASIQPGYTGPDVQFRAGWAKNKRPSGLYHEAAFGFALDGAFRRGQMVGTWKRTTDAGVVVGSGTFNAGSGTWKSVRADGSVMAQGPFANSRAAGTWKFFHRSGRLAATGPMKKGKRAGTWTFFYDEPGNVKLATGEFKDGEVIGGWKHFDASGKLVATAVGHSWGDEGLTLVIQPGPDGIRHQITQGEPANDRRLDSFFLGEEKLYVTYDEMYDGRGNKLARTGGTWTARACSWSGKKRKAAASGNAGRFYYFLGRPEHDPVTYEPKPEPCEGPVVAVPPKRAAILDTMLASTKTLHAPIPAWSIGEASPDVDAADEGMPDDTSPSDVITHGQGPVRIVVDNPLDLTTMLADHMKWYMEWPHVDDTFVAVYGTIPGYTGPTED